MIDLFISIILIVSSIFIIGYEQNKAAEESLQMTNKEHNLVFLSRYKKKLGIGNLTNKGFIEFMKKYGYCSKNTTKADIKYGDYITIKCNKGFSKSFIHFINKYNCINTNSDRVEKLNCISVFKDVNGMKDIKFIKDTNNYKELTIEFRN